MTCERIVFPDGTFGHMCGEPIVDVPPSCSECGAPDAEYLCDGPAPEGSGRVTCDAPLCRGCTSQTDPLVTIPTDLGFRTALRLAAGNWSGPGERTSAPERAMWRKVMDPVVAEPHDYCPRCSREAARDPGGDRR